MQNRAFRAVLPLVLALLAPVMASARGTLDSILPEIRAQHPGRLSDAEPWTDGEGNTHYRIKWMTPEGRILFFDADARSGRYAPSGGADWRNHRGDYGRGDYGRGDDEMGPGDRRSHFAGEDGNGNGNGNDWRNRDPVNNPWTRGGGEWRDRGQGGDGRNQRGGGNRGGNGNGWGGGGHGGGDNHRHGH